MPIEHALTHLIQCITSKERDRGRRALKSHYKGVYTNTVTLLVPFSVAFLTTLENFLHNYVSHADL